MTTRSIITIGNFDGVHAGHAALLQRAREIAGGTSAGGGDGGGARVVAMAFDPHPLEKLRPEVAPARLTMWGRREELLRFLGADDVVRLEPTKELLGMSPGEFVEWLVAGFAPAAVVEGPDFHFGRGRSGTMETLAELGAENGFGVEVVQPVEVQLSDGSVVTASSTLARWLVEQGRVRDAAAVLGRPHEVEGVVEPGDRRGRQIGYPTANLRTECLLPADGVYAGLAHLPGGQRATAAISVGDKPTFGENKRTIEAFVLQTAEGEGGGGGRQEGSGRGGVVWRPLPGLPEYGWPLRLEIRHWLRDQAKYGSLDALLAQMDRDCERTRELIEFNSNAAGGIPGKTKRSAACP